jgi:hypothetical protein
MAIWTRWSPSPVTRPAHSPSTMARPSSSRPSSAKKARAASRDATTMPTLSIRVSAMCPFYNLSSVLSTNERPGGSTNNRVLSCHDVVSRCAPDALCVERYLSSRACHQWKHLPRTLRRTLVCLLLRFLPKSIKYRSLSLNAMSGSFLRRTHTLRRSCMLAIPYTTHRWSASSRYPGHLGESSPSAK